jgi:peptidyl-prolyl cis-trans isomerase SurA
VPAAPVQLEPKYAATEVLIRFAGAAGAPATVTRSEAEAKARAEEVFRRASAGEDLETLARAMSEGPAAARGGKLGVYRTGTMVPEFESAVARVSVGSLAPPFRTAFGWHVVRRDAVVEIAARHLLVTYAGAWRSTSTRTKDQARARVEEALRKLEGGADFAALAREYSEDASAVRGGELGVIAPGQMVPAFEEAAFGLSVGAHSGIVETPYGFHLVLRTK